jgi:HlyD family secretion protein
MDAPAVLSKLTRIPNFQKAKIFLLGHKIISSLVLLSILGGSYYAYTAYVAAHTPTTYFVQDATVGTIVSTVSGTGQVAATSQIALTSQASGPLTSIRVKVGDFVHSGTVIATINPGTAGLDLANAELSLEQARTNNTTSLTDAQSSLASSKDASINQIASGYGSLDQVIATIGPLYLDNAYLHPDYSNDGLEAARSAAYNNYVAAKDQLTLAEHQTGFLTRDSSVTDIQTQLDTLYAVSKKVATAALGAQTATQNLRSLRGAPTVDQAATGAWNTSTTAVSSSNSIVSSVSSSKQSLQTAQTTLTNATGSTGGLTIRQAELLVAQRAQTYSTYFVKAPFDAVVATVDVQKGTQVGGSTQIVTLVTKNEVAQLTLNEVDVAKVKVGQKATLTFSAVPALTLSGTIASVAGAGTVTQGVVNYAVTIAFDTQDTRIKPGMSVSAAIQTGVAQNVVTVPVQAVKTVQGQSYVQVFSPALTPSADATQGILSAVAPTRDPVEIGITDSKNVEIVSGVTEGQQIVVRSTTGTATVKSAASSATTRSTGGTGFGGGPRTP